jgi:hypothetical protein
MRSDAVRKIGGFEESFQGFYEDQAFLTKMYLTEPVYVSSGCWERYRIHRQSCSAVVKDEGQYDAFRETFLRWFQTYLYKKGAADPEVLNLVEEALRPYQIRSSLQGASPSVEWLRLLRVTDGNVARLEYPTNNPDVVRIAIAKAGTKLAYDIS